MWVASRSVLSRLILLPRIWILDHSPLGSNSRRNCNHSYRTDMPWWHNISRVGNCLAQNSGRIRISPAPRSTVIDFTGKSTLTSVDRAVKDADRDASSASCHKTSKIWTHVRSEVSRSCRCRCRHARVVWHSFLVPHWISQRTTAAAFSNRHHDTRAERYISIAD